MLVSVPINFHYMDKKYNGSQWETKLKQITLIVAIITIKVNGDQSCKTASFTMLFCPFGD